MENCFFALVKLIKLAMREELEKVKGHKSFNCKAVEWERKGGKAKDHWS